jgi:hypothetical protein
MTSTFQYKGHYVRINPGDTIELIIDDEDLTDWLLNQEGCRPRSECEFWPQEVPALDFHGRKFA